MLQTMTHIRIAILVATLALLMALTSCGGGDGTVLEQQAAAFSGGSLTTYGGLDSDEPVARQTARDILVGREFDFTTAGFTIAPGTVSSAAAGGSPRFGASSGTLETSGDTATVVLNITSRDGSVTSPQATGTFSLSDAQRAVNDAGASFTVDWELDFEENGTPYSISVEQVLSGTNWTI
jgi:hypothetical protein